MKKKAKRVVEGPQNQSAFDLFHKEPEVFIDEIEFEKQKNITLSDFPKLENGRIWNNVNTHSPTWKEQSAFYDSGFSGNTKKKAKK